MPNFGYDNSSTKAQGAATNEEVTDLDNGKVDNTDIDNVTTTVPNNDDVTQNPDNSSKDNNKNDGTEEESNNNGLVEGTIIEFDNNKYTVDKNGNLVTEDGTIFKEAKDVDDFIKEFDKVDEQDNELNINNILNHVGVDIVGEDGNPIEFENSVEGISSYINSVIEQQQDEFARAGVNQLFNEYPVLQDFLNYYIANGNSVDGFGQVCDRSGIVLDENNVAQQEAIIRQSFQEFGKRGNVDEYIQYLKDKDMLFDTAKDELQGLIDSDNAYKEQIAQQAREAVAEQEREETEYWNGVHQAIKERKIAGYQIPETIIINRDGKKIAATPNDFFNYVYQVDEQGNSRYANDLANLTLEQKRDDALLRAYLRFTGGTYADLVNLAIKDQEVKTLRFKAKDNNKRVGRIIPPTPKAQKGVKTDYGYNG